MPSATAYLGISGNMVLQPAFLPSKVNELPAFIGFFTLFISVPYHDDVLKNCQNIAQETSSQSIVLLRVLWSYATISFSSEVMRP
jgi:hypothetical protein